MEEKKGMLSRIHSKPYPSFPKAQAKALFEEEREIKKMTKGTRKCLTNKNWFGS